LMSGAINGDADYLFGLTNSLLIHDTPKSWK